MPKALAGLAATTLKESQSLARVSKTPGCDANPPSDSEGVAYLGESRFWQFSYKAVQVKQILCDHPQGVDGEREGSPVVDRVDRPAILLDPFRVPGTRRLRKNVERETGLEPATACLGSRESDTRLNLTYR